MKIAHILAAFGAHPWAILPAKLEEIRAFLHLRAGGGEIDPATIQALAASRRSDDVQMYGRVAVVPVMGVLSQRVSMLEECSGGIGADAIGRTLDGVAADKTVSKIVMAFDSPGGSVLGIAELAAKIRAAKEIKPVIGLADSIAASAAYWLASQCTELCCTPGGQVGSIGVISVHDDCSKALEIAGVKPTQITSAQFKGENSPDYPLSDEARAANQTMVNSYHAMFVAEVAKGRGVTVARVEKDFGQGRMKLADDAKASGMIDRVSTLEQVLRRAGVASSEAAAAEAQSPVPDDRRRRNAAKARALAVQVQVRES